MFPILTTCRHRTSRRDAPLTEGYPNPSLCCNCAGESSGCRHHETVLAELFRILARISVARHTRIGRNSRSDQREHRRDQRRIRSRHAHLGKTRRTLSRSHRGLRRQGSKAQRDHRAPSGRARGRTGTRRGATDERPALTARSTPHSKPARSPRKNSSNFVSLASRPTTPRVQSSTRSSRSIRARSRPHGHSTRSDGRAARAHRYTASPSF